MDFNTGAGGTGDSGGPSACPGGSPQGAQSAAAEFRYTDPVQTFIATVQAVVLRPVDFFRGILRQGDLINPLIFALICYEVAAILGGLLRLVGFGASNQYFVGFLVSIILAPFFAAIGLFIGAGILHLLVMLIVGSRNSGFEATFRVVAYSAVDRKSTRLNSSHANISYAVFCLKKKNTSRYPYERARTNTQHR